MASASISALVKGFSRQTRALLGKYAPFALGKVARAATLPDRIELLAHALLSSRGEASGVALATDLLALYELASPDDRVDFFLCLAKNFAPDEAALNLAWTHYQEVGKAALTKLAQAVEAPRQELFRRINLAPGGTASLVRMRAALIDAVRTRPCLDAVDADLAHLLQSWFNRGFLTMQPITWSSPASLLERVIRYEAVHHISDWQDLRGRLDPADRRCFGFFHPAMPGEPLIFVEVALTDTISDNIQEVLRADRCVIEATAATTAMFYSISNCQPGLRGISFGHFLIKQVATDLQRALPNLRCFATLSPIPGFGSYLKREAQPLISQLDDIDDRRDELRDRVLDYAVTYFTESKTPDGRPADPVARFHLGNGAELYRLNWRGDTSANGLRQSVGLMVNYLYDLSRIEENHEAYAHRGVIAQGEPFRRLARVIEQKQKSVTS